MVAMNVQVSEDSYIESRLPAGPKREKTNINCKYFLGCEQVVGFLRASASLLAQLNLFCPYLTGARDLFFSGRQQMKMKLNLMIFFVFVSVFLMIQPLSLFAELIEPSRTLEGQEKPMGRLSVFSEPPELDVLLDDVNIGKTPVISKEVKSGVHILRVKETEKEITILPGKPLQLSLFKDVLIEIPEKKVETPTQPKSEEKRTIKKKSPEKSNINEKENNPIYWPMNPFGPIPG